MRGRLLLLTGGAVSDLALPLAGSAAVAFGPEDVGAPPVSIALPLVGSAATAVAPLTVVVASDVSASLPVAGISAVAVAPTIANDLSMSLPVVGNVATGFGPRVVPYVNGDPTTPVNDPDELVLTLHENDGTLIRTLGKWRSFEFADPLKVSQPGSGELVLQRIIEAGAANPAIADVDHDCIVRVTFGGDTCWQMLVEGLNHNLIGPGEEAAETTTASGRHAVLGELDKVRVFPDAGLNVRPWGNTRYFNYSADDLVDNTWGFATATPPHYDEAVPNYGRPEGFPDFTAQWIWDRSSHVNVPGGDCYFRHRFTNATARDALVIAAADDEVEVWLDGVPILTVEGVYKGGSLSAEVELSAGNHLICARGRNLNALHAGILITVMTVSDSMPDAVITNTQAATWRVLGYPAQAPGFTATEVLVLLVAEAQARGELTDLDLSFLASHDTNGEPVVVTTDIACRHGDSYLTVCGQLSESYLDIAGASASKTLHAWNRGTRGTNVNASYTKGTNITSLTHDETSDAQATVAFVQWAGGAPFERVHADAATVGRKVVSLEFGDVRSLSLARRLADAYLDTASAVRWGIRLGIHPTNDQDRPYRGVWPGDSPLAPGVDLTPGRHRVAMIGLRVDARSRPEWSMGLEQPQDLDAERLSAIMRRQLPGSAGGRTLLPSPISPAFPPSAAGSEKTQTWSAPIQGTYVLTKNGTPITGATLSANGRVTLTAAARKYVRNVDQIDFTIDGVAGFDAPWTPTDGRWLQEFRVTEGATGVTITVSYT